MSIVVDMPMPDHLITNLKSKKVTINEHKFSNNFGSIDKTTNFENLSGNIQSAVDLNENIDPSN